MTAETMQSTPPFYAPSLAATADKPPSGENWIHEIKYDGYRIQARIQAGVVHFLTRKGIDYTDRFRETAKALGGLGLADAVFDGEIVVENDKGVSDIKLLYADMTAGRRDRFIFYAFDMLQSGDRDLRKLPLIERKTMLEKALSVNVLDARIRYSQHIQGDGQRMLDYAATMGIEGIMSKRADLPYRSGRGSHWLKSKCTARQEFIVIGYILSDKMSGSVGSLALGYYSTAGELVYAGRVGTGYSTKEAIAFAQGLPVIRVPKLDCLNVPADDAKNVCWIQPRFVADIEFRGWTKERLLWQPSYKVLRDDKDPAEVVLEEAGERFTPPSQPSP